MGLGGVFCRVPHVQSCAVMLVLVLILGNGFEPWSLGVLVVSILTWRDGGKDDGLGMIAKKAAGWTLTRTMSIQQIFLGLFALACCVVILGAKVRE